MKKRVIAHMLSCGDEVKSVAKLAQLHVSSFAIFYSEYSTIQKVSIGFFIEVLYEFSQWGFYNVVKIVGGV